MKEVKVKPTQTLYTNNVVAVPPPPPRFSLNEWYLNNRQRYRACEDQQALADKILAECERVRDEVKERTLLNKREVDHKINEKIQDIEFNKHEIDRQRKVVCSEIECLTLYKERIMDAMASLKDQSMRICKKCLIFREGRIGIDLCHDDVERELLKEIDVIEGANKLLVRVLEQANEQVRRLRSTIYFMDRDSEDKDNVLKIDGHNLSLNENSMNLSLYYGYSPLDVATITVEEWEIATTKNIERAAKEINSARPLRAYVDVILKQVIDDLVGQYHTVNDAFRRRIEETKESKYKLEIQHLEVVRQVNEMTRNITDLEKAIADKEGFMALAHTRLGNRAQRPGAELCRDLVETNLVNEVRELRHNTHTLQHMLSEAQASLRYLLKIQIQLEEDINIKTNTLKIDEVDCMTLRQSMDYHAY
ncbi:tektin-1 [Onthophagus taurus]|uniref:tektin-1 n=1 Tax=Onthophagus taurus TaxID=166361 RepID=UPI000C207264|nr:tektin-1 [Onthophagus taurus]